MKAEEELPLRILSDYRLEFRMEENRALYRFGIFASPVCRVLTVVLVFLAFLLSPYFATGIPVCIALSIVFDNLAKKSVYTLEYSWHNGIFKVTFISLDGEEKCLESVDCRSIAVEKVDFLPENTIDYSIKSGRDSIKVLIKNECDRKNIFVTPDKYMYALIAEGSVNGLSR